ncbi:MAG TPA: hypothetical protein VK993_14960 [Chthoniobacterales bacterium]|nr:hypothetical protein [Chthoniobacterales bacterium]
MKQADAPTAGELPFSLRLPAEGQHDPVFGCPRQKYLQLEREGAIQLIRLVPEGKSRGIVLVPVDQMQAHLRRLQEPKGGQP